MGTLNKRDVRNPVGQSSSVHYHFHSLGGESFSLALLVKRFPEGNSL